MVVSDLTVSLVDILLTLSVAEFFRSQLLTEANYDWTVHKCVQEFVAVFELCVVICELGFILNLDGMWVFGAFLFLILLWWNLRWTVATGSHFLIMEDWLLGYADFISVILIALAGSCGGLIYHRYFLRTLWGLWQSSSIGAGSLHEAKLANMEACQTSIKVSVVCASLIEGGVVFLLRLIAKIMVARQWNPFLMAFIQATLTTVCICSAVGFTGGYFNPALGTSSQYGCTGSHWAQNAMVFWLAPTIGALATFTLWFHTPLRNLVKGGAE